MDLQEFTDKLNQKIDSKVAHLTEEEVYKAHKNYIDYHRNTNPNVLYVISMEEMAELTQHLSKLVRGKESIDNKGILEELADVQICIDNLVIALGLDKETLEYAKDVKLERVANKIQNRIM